MAQEAELLLVEIPSAVEVAVVGAEALPIRLEVVAVEEVAVLRLSLLCRLVRLAPSVLLHRALLGLPTSSAPCCTSF